MIRTAVLFHRFGPYHHARLRALGQAVDLVGIELSAVDETYAWKREQAAAPFQHLTLFRERDAVHEKGGEVRRRVRAALEESQVEAVAVPGWADRGALAALDWCVRRRVPVVMMSESTMHDSSRVWWKETIKRSVVRRCQAGLVGGAPHVDYLARLGMPRERIFVGYDVVDNDHFARGAETARSAATKVRQELGLPEQFFLASNRFIAKKNLAHLLRAFAAYRARAGRYAWGLVLLGDGAFRPELLQLRAELRLEDAVQMPGFKQYHELPAYYGLAGAFVHASTTEQWGLVVNEAMAAGLPVLVSRPCGCVVDLVHDGQNGFVFDPFDADELAKLLLKVAAGEYDLTSMGDASRRIIAAWTPETFGLNLSKALAVALEGPSRRTNLFDQVLLWGLAHQGG